MLAAAAGAVALGAALLTPPGGAYAEYNCSNGAVVVVSGTGNTTGQDMAKLVSEAGDKDVIQINGRYTTSLWPLGSVGFNSNVRSGVDEAHEKIAAYQKYCAEKEKPAVEGAESDAPQTYANPAITVVGYSQGGRIAGDILSAIGNGRWSDVSAENVNGVLYADPRQNGSDILGRGIEQAFLGVIPGISMTGERENGFGTLAGQVVSVCNQGDMICDMPDLLHNPLGTLDSLIGYLTGKHTDYIGVQIPGYQEYLKLLGNPGAITGPDGIAGAGTCVQSPNNGGLVCTYAKESQIGVLVRGVVVQLANALGVPVDPAQIPDVYGDLAKTLNLNWLFPHANLSDLQPVANLIFGVLPELPYVTYNAGGYLTDLNTAGDLINGAVTVLQGGSGADLRTAATAIAKSVASLLLIPVNGGIYWSNEIAQKLGGDKIFPNGGIGLGYLSDLAASNTTTFGEFLGIVSGPFTSAAGNASTAVSALSDRAKATIAANLASLRPKASAVAPVAPDALSEQQPAGERNAGSSSDEASRSPAATPQATTVKTRVPGRRSPSETRSSGPHRGWHQGGQRTPTAPITAAPDSGPTNPAPDTAPTSPAPDTAPAQPATPAQPAQPQFGPLSKPSVTGPGGAGSQSDGHKSRSNGQHTTPFGQYSPSNGQPGARTPSGNPGTTGSGTTGGGTTGGGTAGGGATG